MDETLPRISIRLKPWKASTVFIVYFFMMTKILSFFLAVSVFILPLQGWAITDAEEIGEAITENVFEAEIPDAPEVNAGDVGRYTSIAAGVSNSLHISYFDSTNWDLKYAFYDSEDNFWRTSIIDNLTKPATIPDGLHTSIATDPRNGNPRIAYYNANSQDLKFAKYVGSGGNCGQSLDWKCQTIASTGNVGSYPSIVIDSAGLAHVSYFEWATFPTYGYLNYGKEQANGTWQFQRIQSGGVGYYSSIDVDSTNTPAISYYDSINGDLKYARKQTTGANCGSSQWKCETVDSTNNVGLYTSLEFDVFDTPHISYLDFTNADFKYAKRVAGGCGGGAWACSTVRSAGSVGHYSSLTISSANIIYVSYYDATNADLNLAWKKPTDTFWYSVVVDSVGTVGSYSSLVLDSSGARSISYYDKTNGDLKFAKNVSSGGNCRYNWRCTTLDQ